MLVDPSNIRYGRSGNTSYLTEHVLPCLLEDHHILARIEVTDPVLRVRCRGCRQHAAAQKLSETPDEAVYAWDVFMIIQCQSCSKKLKVPDSAAGKKAKCPGCESLIAIEPSGDRAAPSAKRARKSAAPGQRKAAASRTADAAEGQRSATNRKRPKKKTKKRRPPADDLFGDDFGDLSQGEDYDEYENPYAAPRATGTGGQRKRSQGRKQQGLGTVGAGLLVQGWAIAGAILLVAAVVILSMTTPAGAPNGAAIMLLGIGSIAAAIAVFVGEAMCLAAPTDSGAKGLIISTVCFSVLNIIFSIVNNVVEPNLALAAGGGLTGLGRIVLFLLFLRTIARYAGYHERGDRAIIILIGMPTSVMAMVGGMFVLPALLAGLLAFACSIALLVFTVMYVFLLFGLGGDLRT